MAVTFTLSTSKTGSAGTDLWVDLGLIPVGFNYCIGSLTVTTTTKPMMFELRTNLSGKNVGTVAATKVLALAMPKIGASITQDLYKSGTLHTSTIKGTGSEHWWVHITSTSKTAATYLCKISYAKE